MIVIRECSSVVISIQHQSSLVLELEQAYETAKSDPAFGQGTWCYLVHIENRYGAARPATDES